jgi:hypothetical protein
MLIVDKKSITPSNPTGMTVPLGKSLTSINWEHFKSTLPTGVVPPFSALNVILVMRGGDPVCSQFERVSEILNLEYHKEPVNHDAQLSVLEPKSNASRPASASIRPASASTRPTSSSTRPSSGKQNIISRIKEKPNLLKVDISENGTIMKELGIRSIPMFLMYHGANLVYGGSAGGRKIKLEPCVQKPQILYIEPNFQHQIRAEKTLHKMGCDVSLCMTVGEAVNRIQIMKNDTGNPNAPKLDFDIVLISDETVPENLNLLEKALFDNIKNKRTIICLMISVLGENGRNVLNAVTWESFATDNLALLGHPAIASLCTLAVQKPIKPSAVTRAMSMLQNVSHHDSNFGLTPSTLRSKISAVHDDVISGTAKPLKTVGIRISAEDTRMRGVALSSSM